MALLYICLLIPIGINIKRYLIGQARYKVAVTLIFYICATTEVVWRAVQMLIFSIECPKEHFDCVMEHQGGLRLSDTMCLMFGWIIYFY